MVDYFKIVNVLVGLICAVCGFILLIDTFKHFELTIFVVALQTIFLGLVSVLVEFRRPNFVQKYFHFLFRLATRGAFITLLGALSYGFRTFTEVMGAIVMVIGLIMSILGCMGYEFPDAPDKDGAPPPEQPMPNTA